MRSFLNVKVHVFKPYKTTVKPAITFRLDNILWLLTMMLVVYVTLQHKVTDRNLRCI